MPTARDLNLKTNILNIINHLENHSDVSDPSKAETVFNGIKEDYLGETIKDTLKKRDLDYKLNNLIEKDLAEEYHFYLALSNLNQFSVIIDDHYVINQDTSLDEFLYQGLHPIPIEKLQVFILNRGNNHWNVCAFDKENKVLFLFDPLGSPHNHEYSKGEELKTCIEEYFNSAKDPENKDKRSNHSLVKGILQLAKASRIADVNLNDYTIISTKKACQRDSNNCGYFSILFCQFIADLTKDERLDLVNNLDGKINEYLLKKKIDVSKGKNHYHSYLRKAVKQLQYDNTKKFLTKSSNPVQGRLEKQLRRVRIFQFGVFDLIILSMTLLSCAVLYPSSMAIGALVLGVTAAYGISDYLFPSSTSEYSTTTSFVPTYDFKDRYTDTPPMIVSHHKETDKPAPQAKSEPIVGN